jgi:Na+/glutamate symporter
MDMSSAEKLPKELLWSEDGHLSDVVLTAMADAQHEIVPDEATVHAEACALCAKRVGGAALLSLRAGELLAEVAPAVPARAPVPVYAVVGAIVLAALGALPGLVSMPTEITQDIASFSQKLHLVVANAALLARAATGETGPLYLSLTFGSALLLLLVAFGVMKLAPRREGVVR